MIIQKLIKMNNENEQQEVTTSNNDTISSSEGGEESSTIIQVKNDPLPEYTERLDMIINQQAGTHLFLGVLLGAYLVHGLFEKFKI